MAILKCDFETFNSKVSEISSLVERYNTLLLEIEVLENQVPDLWESEAQQAYYSKFMERKADLQQLSIYYSDLINFLKNTINTYQRIEEKYS